MFNRGRVTSDERSTSISVIRRLPLACYAGTASGGRLSPLRTRSPVAVPCLISTSSDSENSADDFRNLFMCEFVDDKASVFLFEDLQRCMVDSRWKSGKTCAVCRRPFNWRPVWMGYDPSHTGDSAAVRCWLRRLSPGQVPHPERHQWKGMDFAAQAEAIRQLTEKYTSTTSVSMRPVSAGFPAGSLVLSWRRAISHTPEMKTAMVLKAKDTIRAVSGI